MRAIVISGDFNVRIEPGKTGRDKGHKAESKPTKIGLYLYAQLLTEVLENPQLNHHIVQGTEHVPVAVNVFRQTL